MKYILMKGVTVSSQSKYWKGYIIEGGGSCVINGEVFRNVVEIGQVI
jgi:hypothetical protein